MAFQVVPNTASFRIRMQQVNTLVETINTFYVRNINVGWSAARLTIVATAIGDAWRDNMMPELQNVMLFDRIDARDEGAEFGLETVAEYNTLGTVAGTPLSLQSAIFTKVIGESGGAPRRGGLFVSGFGEADLTIDTWAAAKTAAVQAALQDVDTAVGAIGVGDVLVLVSRFNKLAFPTPPHKRTQAVTNPVASFDTQEFLASQRDRRTGIGS